MLRIIFLGSLLSVFLPLKAVEPLVLTSSLQEVWVGKDYALVYEDTSAILTLKEVEKKAFKEIRVNNLKNTNTASVYWLKFLLVDKRTSDNPLRIELYDFDLDEISFYQQDRQGEYVAQVAGYDLPFGERQLGHKNVSFHIDPVWRDSSYVFLRFKSHGHNVLKPVVRSYTKVINYGLTEYLLLGVFYGLLLLMIFYNLTYYFFMKSRNSLYYVLYASSVLFYLMSENGTGFQYLWPRYPVLNDYVSMVLLMSSEVFLLLFTRSYLEIDRYHPRLKKLMIVLLLARLAIASVQLGFRATQEWEFIDVIFVQVILFVGVKAYRRGFSVAKWFVYAFCALDVGYTITYMERAGLLLSNVYTVYAFYGGVVVQFVFLSIAIAEGIKDVFVRKNIIQSQLIEQYKVNESLSEKVNKELEDKVCQRTKELQDAQTALKTQAEEITKMNLALDNANRQLARDFSSVVKESTQRGRFTFEEFMKAYPDNSSCKRFISEIKEKKGFMCKKCKATKEIKGKNPLDRRCAACNYNESITANTIFHHSRFPLYKGFYMLYYYMHVDKRQISLHQLSLELGVHQNSLQLFRKKVDARIEKLKKHPSSWEEVVLDPKR